MTTRFVIDNWYLFGALAVVLGLLIGPLLRQRLHGVQQLNPAQTVQVINRESGVVVDVCEPQEFKTGHIANAINLPLGGLKDSIKQLEKYKGKPIIVTCRSGNRSAKGAVVLRQLGFAPVFTLTGGLIAWERDNLPLEK